MIFVILAIVILFVSFVIALISLIREQREERQLFEAILEAEKKGPEPSGETVAQVESPLPADKKTPSAEKLVFPWENVQAQSPGAKIESTVPAKPTLGGEISIRDLTKS